MIPPPPTSTLFPYTTLFRSQLHHSTEEGVGIGVLHEAPQQAHRRQIPDALVERGREERWKLLSPELGDGVARYSERSEEHTSELQSHVNLVCRLLLEKKNKK